MSRPVSSSAALPIAHVVLRILIVLNWLGGAAILALLVLSPNAQWIMAAFKLSPSPDTDRLIMGMRAVAVLGLAAIPLHYLVLKRLLAIIETVRVGAGRAERSQYGDRHDRQGRFDAGASAPLGCRLFDQRLARRTPHVPAGPCVCGGHAYAGRPGRDGVTWRSPSSSTTCSTIVG